ncbi:hypothetical protein NDU88_003916 [Pleurodeles waltl]|uniref:Secreted protein n=1 Tax=Pleurodeles waltl TaxID=8319 RepID=A0AAV7W7J2_PLEWA|nr:hypothetical protein NDU88_003916 [Pleurodeles waltl]
MFAGLRLALILVSGGFPIRGAGALRTSASQLYTAPQSQTYSQGPLCRPRSPPVPFTPCRHHTERKEQNITAPLWRASRHREQQSLPAAPYELALLLFGCRSGSFSARRLRTKRSPSAGLLPVEAAGSPRCAISVPIAPGGQESAPDGTAQVRGDHPVCDHCLLPQAGPI